MPNRPSYNPQTPKKGTKGYDRVVSRGCGGYRDYWGEYDCDHGYGWGCDHCPWLLEHEVKGGEKEAKGEVVIFLDLTDKMNTLNKQTDLTKEN